MSNMNEIIRLSGIVSFLVGLAVFLDDRKLQFKGNETPDEFFTVFEEHKALLPKLKEKTITLDDLLEHIL